MKRALESLDFLCDRGYETATLLRSVLYSVDRALLQDALNRPRWSRIAYAKALRTLKLAQESRQLKQIALGRHPRKMDSACLLLRRTVGDLEALIGLRLCLDPDRTYDIDLLRTRIVESLVSVVTAEMEARAAE